jgi:hypothetical protein
MKDALDLAAEREMCSISDIEYAVAHDLSYAWEGSPAFAKR